MFYDIKNSSGHVLVQLLVVQEKHTASAFEGFWKLPTGIIHEVWLCSKISSSLTNLSFLRLHTYQELRNKFVRSGNGDIKNPNVVNPPGVTQLGDIMIFM